MSEYKTYLCFVRNRPKGRKTIGVAFHAESKEEAEKLARALTYARLNSYDVVVEKITEYPHEYLDVLNRANIGAVYENIVD